MSVMTCSSSRSHPDGPTGLSDRTRAVRQLASQRSLLPAAPTPNQLLTILHDAARLLPFSPSSSVGTDLTASPAGTAAYGDYIRRQCPTSRRIHSSFAAAGAHSPLGEMLQFFAVSLTHLFSDGVGSAAALSFPAAWEQRLNAPDAAALRDDYLYELQGFSALFTYVWGCVAAMHSTAHADGATAAVDDEREEEAEDSTATTAAGRGFAASSSSTLPASPEAREGKVRRATRRQRTADGSDPAAAAAVAAAAVVASLPQLGAQASSLTHDSASPAASPPSSKSHVVGMTVTSAGIADAALPHSTRRQHSPSEARGVPAHTESKKRSHFLPSLPVEGLVPSSSLPMLHVGAGTQRKGKSLPQASTTTTSSSIAKEGQSTHLSRSAKQQAIAAAMEQDHLREVGRKLGVQQVRNFAQEGDMQEYLHSFQKNMHSMLDDDTEGEGSVG